MWYKNIRTLLSCQIKNSKNNILVQLDIGTHNKHYNLRKYSIVKTLYHENYFPLKYGKFLLHQRTKFLKNNTIPISDPAVAQTFADIIVDDLAKNANFVIDILPGEGYLLAALLERNISNLYTFEHANEICKTIKNLEAQYPGRLHCINISFYLLAEYLSGKRLWQGQYIQDVVKNLPKAKWSDPPLIQMVGVGKTKFFLSQVLLATVFNTKFLSRGRITFYLAVGPVLWKTLHGDSSNFIFYRFSSVLFQLFFDEQVLGYIDDPKFQAKFKSRAFERCYGNIGNDHRVKVVRVEPKPDIYDELTKEQIFGFWFFLRTVMSRRTTRLIPILESWIPGCAPLLISQNYTMYTLVGDLSPKELLNAFMIFQSLPGYEVSTFYYQLQRIQGLCE